MAWLAQVSATFIRGLCMAVCACVLALPAAAQETAKDFPTRPVTLIVPFAAGGGLDMIARQLQPLLEQRWGKALIIENRPGAGTSLGAAAAAKAAPDGYTMLFGTTSPLSIAVNVYKSVPYDPVKDFIPVARIGNAAFVFIATPDLKIKTLAEFIAMAKGKPGQISFGSGGTGSMQHLFAELLQSMSGIKMVHVPYRGDNPVITDIIAGHIPVAFVEMGVAMPYRSRQGGAARRVVGTARAGDAQRADDFGIRRAGIRRGVVADVRGPGGHPTSHRRQVVRRHQRGADATGRARGFREGRTYPVNADVDRGNVRIHPHRARQMAHSDGNGGRGRKPVVERGR